MRPILIIPIAIVAFAAWYLTRKSNSGAPTAGGTVQQLTSDGKTTFDVPINRPVNAGVTVSVGRPTDSTGTAGLVVATGLARELKVRQL